MDYNGIQTKIIHYGEENFSDVISPIHLTSTYKMDDLEPKGRFYLRYDNESREVLEKKLALVEKSKYCLAFSSGMAAITSVIFSLLNSQILKPNSLILAFDDLYSVTKKIFDNILPKYNIRVKYIDFSMDYQLPENERVSMVWLESPTNPFMKMTDVKDLINRIKYVYPDVITVFDNTFLTPYFYNPVDDNVDIIVHSTTKYINGHSDSLGGAVVTNNDELYQKIREYRNIFGNALSPFDSFLTTRGLKTLPLRMEKHQQNALKVIDYLKTKSFVDKIFYPSFYSKISPSVRGFGGTLSFTLKFDIEQIKSFVESLSLISYAVSLGGVESLICVPRFSTHKGVESVPENLIRLSVGIEEFEDIISDLDQAFNKVLLNKVI
jgi:cystathionine gamma-lyase